MRLLLALILAAAPAQALAESLNLVCSGTGTWPDIERSSGMAFSGNRSAWGSGTSYSVARDTQQFRVEVSDSSGRIKVPRVMVPQLNGGGTADGWWTLKDVSVGQDRITGQFSFNWLNNPKVIIDRRTGEIDVKGSYHFSFNGQCDAAPVEPEARRF